MPCIGAVNAIAKPSKKLELLKCAFFDILLDPIIASLFTLTTRIFIHEIYPALESEYHKKAYLTTPQDCQIEIAQAELPGFLSLIRPTTMPIMALDGALTQSSVAIRF